MNSTRKRRRKESKNTDRDFAAGYVSFANTAVGYTSCSLFIHYQVVDKALGE
jgi:hypothetical protein